MDDVNEKLNALLSDPGSMAQIMQLAQQLSGSMGGENTPPSPPSPPQAVPPPAPLGGIDPQTIARYLPLLQELTRDTSQTTQLLYALRPWVIWTPATCCCFFCCSTSPGKKRMKSCSSP